MRLVPMKSVSKIEGTRIDMQDWNSRVIDEFHANEGKVGGPFEGRTMLLLTTTGAKSGKRRTTPLVYLADGDRLLIFASKGGAPTNPDWYHNLVAHPDATVEIGTETKSVRARVAAGDERTRIWETQKERYPGFAEYERNTDREIPVVILEPVG